MWSRGNGKQASSTAGVSPFFPRVAGEFVWVFDLLQMGSLVAGWGKGCTCDFSGVLAQSWAMVPTSLLRKSLIQDSQLGNQSTELHV